MPFKSKKQRQGFFGNSPKPKSKQSRYAGSTKPGKKEQSVWSPKPKPKPKVVPIYNYRVTKTEVKTVAQKPTREDADIMASRLTESTGVKHTVVAEKTSRTKVVRQ